MNACHASRESASSPGPAGLLEDARRRVAGHVVVVARDLDLAAAPDVPAHRLHRLHLGVRPPDEPGLLRPEAPDVDVDVVVVGRVEEVGEHVGELVVQTRGGAPVEGEAAAQLARPAHRSTGRGAAR